MYKIKYYEMNHKKTLITRVEVLKAYLNSVRNSTITQRSAQEFF
jgi:hypothetical protein